MIAAFLTHGESLLSAVRRTLNQSTGAFSLVVLDSSQPGVLIAARKGNAGGLVVGLADDGTYVASDMSALLTYTRKFFFLEPGEVATLEPSSVVQGSRSLSMWWRRTASRAAAGRRPSRWPRRATTSPRWPGQLWHELIVPNSARMTRITRAGTAASASTGRASRRSCAVRRPVSSRSDATARRTTAGRPARRTAGRTRNA